MRDLEGSNYWWCAFIQESLQILRTRYAVKFLTVKFTKKNLCYNFPRYDFSTPVLVWDLVYAHVHVCEWCVAWSKSASECVENVVPSLCDASCDVCACTGGVNRVMYNLRPFSLL